MAHRHSIESFQRYEPLIAQILANLPGETRLTEFEHLSLETISARLRDAIEAHHVNHFPSTLVEWDSFTTAYPNLHVSNTGDQVVAWVGKRKRTEAKSNFYADIPLEVLNPPQDCWYPLAVCTACGCFKNGVVLKLTYDLAPKVYDLLQKQILANNLDVGATLCSDSIYLV